MIAIRKQKQSRLLLKILSVFLAITLWFYVLNSEQLEIENKYLIKIDEPIGLAVSSKVPEFVSVKLSGSRAFISKLVVPDDPIILTLSKSEINNKKAILEIKESMIPVAFGVDIKEILPSSIEVELDKVAQKKVPVKARFSGELDPKLRLVTSEIHPDKVTVKGPRSILKEIEYVSTQFLNLGELKVDGTVKVETVVDDRRVSILEENKEVHFSYKVRSKNSNLSLSNIPIYFLSKNRNYKSSHYTVDLELLVVDSDINKFDKKNIRVIAEMNSNLDEEEVKLIAQLPAEAHLVSIKPEVVKIKVK